MFTNSSEHEFEIEIKFNRKLTAQDKQKIFFNNATVTTSNAAD